MAKKNSKPSNPGWISQTKGPKTPEELERARNARDSFRKLREALGLSQPVMAQKLGVSAALIQGIETGNRPVSKEVSALVQARFGVFRESVEGASNKPLTLLEDDVSPESVKRVLNDGTERFTETDFHEFTKPLIRLVKTAANAGMLRIFATSYKDMLNDLTAALGLEERLKAELERAATLRMTMKEIRETPALKRFDDPSKPDDAVGEITFRVPGYSETLFEEPRWISFWDRVVKHKRKSPSEKAE
jgi:transcriptional regulator with XRE-family HTH domain